MRKSATAPSCSLPAAVSCSHASCERMYAYRKRRSLCGRRLIGAVGALIVHAVCRDECKFSCRRIRRIFRVTVRLLARQRRFSSGLLETGRKRLAKSACCRKTLGMSEYMIVLNVAASKLSRNFRSYEIVGTVPVMGKSLYCCKIWSLGKLAARCSAS